MLIEEGKSYRTAGGEKVGPIRAAFWTDEYRWWGQCETGRKCIFQGDGQHGDQENGVPNDPYYNLVSEWVEGPVRTVTRSVTEIVPGIYGIVKVGPKINGRLSVELACSTMGFARSVEELREAATILVELAGALE